MRLGFALVALKSVCLPRLIEMSIVDVRRPLAIGAMVPPPPCTCNKETATVSGTISLGSSNTAFPVGFEQVARGPVSPLDLLRRRPARQARANRNTVAAEVICRWPGYGPRRVCGAGSPTRQAGQHRLPRGQL